MSTKSKTKTKQAQTEIKQVKVQPKKTFDLHVYLLLGMILLFVLLRIRLLDIPLERDEGEYAYIGKLLMEGIAPYKEAYNMKLPGTYFMYALIMSIFGSTTSGIHIGLMLVNAATIAILFFGFRRIFNAPIALFASSVYGLMSLSSNFMGFAAHATQFVSFFSAAGIYFLSVFLVNRKLLTAFLIGLMFGLSFLMKQQAVFFLLLGGILVVVTGILKKPVSFLKISLEGLVYSAGAILPYALTALYLKMAGVFDKFWFWTVTYASKYASGLSLKDGRATFNESFSPMWQEFKIFWFLLLAGLAVTILSKMSVIQKLIAISFTVFAFLTVCPGFYFRQHYFIPFLPAVGLMGGIALNYLSEQLAGLMNRKSFAYLPFVVFIIALFIILPQKNEYYLQPDAETISKNIYGSNPFVESVVISDYIKSNSSQGDKIAVLGSEPQIYFYSDRHAASGHIYTYGLMEENNSYNLKMQEEMISEIEKNKPEFLLICNIGTSWLRRANSPSKIFDWSSNYAQQYYDMVGVTDIISNTQTNYVWGKDVPQYRPGSENLIYIFKKKTQIN